jgi:imidazole glycerol-phosphate synthase subunit HisH
VRKRVVVLDYGSGNLRSAQRALERVGAEVTVTSDLEQAARADGLVVPGVGAYAACMTGIDQLGAGAVISERVDRQAPVLGICVGMQVLFEAGDEHGVVTKGLGLLPGAVTRLDATVVPHMGWNTVAWPEGTLLGAGLDPLDRFYFVHSYAARPVESTGEPQRIRFGVTEHGGQFAAAVEAGVISATQFHPEKSGDVGASLLTNWIGVL